MLSSKFFVSVVASTLLCLIQVSIISTQPIEDGIRVGHPHHGRKHRQPTGVVDRNIPLPENYPNQQSDPESFNFAEDIDDLKSAFQAFSELPKVAYDDIEQSVKRIISEIPGDNIIKNHLKNGLFVMSLYEKVAKGIINLDNDQQVSQMFADGHETLDDLRVEVGGTGSIVQSTMQKAPHVKATKQSLAEVSHSTNTPTETLIGEFTNQSEGLLQKKKKARVGNPSVNAPAPAATQKRANQPSVMAEETEPPYDDIFNDYNFDEHDPERNANPKDYAGVGQHLGAPK